jgi:hypothetical protein
LINQKLRAAGLTKMHSQTIEVMAQEGVDSLCHELQVSSDDEDFDDEDNLDNFNEAGNGTCPTFDGSGETGQRCITCKDASVYLNFQAGL